MLSTAFACPLCVTEVFQLCDLNLSLQTSPPKLSFSTARRRGGNASSLSHLGAGLKPASPGLPLGDSRRFGTVAYVRADASPNESNREFAGLLNLDFG